MENQKIIAIFDENYRAVGFISNDKKLSVEETSHIPTEISTKIKDTIEKYSSEKPRMKMEISTNNGTGIIDEYIEQDDSMFLPAIAEELKRAGIQVRNIPESIKPILVYISTELNAEERSQILGELLNLPFDTEPEALKEFESILFDIVKMKKNKINKP